MDDWNVMATCYARVEQTYDGRIQLTVGLTELEGLVHEYVERLYTPRSDVSDGVNDACRVLSGWGALGALGFSDALERIRAAELR